MAEYHVGTSSITGCIYAGTMVATKRGLEWKNKTEVTTEAIDAVIGHMLVKARNENEITYTAGLIDGRTVKLKLEIYGTKIE